jgi:hypothetical protein
MAVFGFVCVDTSIASIASMFDAETSILLI